MRTKAKTGKIRIFALMVVMAMLMSLISADFSYGAGTAYDFQGQEDMVTIPGGSQKEANAVKLRDFEKDEIIVEKTLSDGDYFLNKIVPEYDGSEVIEFPFSMTAGMNNPFDSDNKLNFEKNCLSSNNRMVNIYQKTEEYTGNWNEDSSKIAKGALQIDYDPEKTYKNPANNDNNGRITLYLPANTLDSGTYILEFGKNVCGNQTSKILGVPVAFEFTVQGLQTLEDALITANGLYERLTDPGNIGTGSGCYNVTDDEIAEFKRAIDNGEDARNGTEYEQTAAAQALSKAIDKIERKRTVTINASITGIADGAAVDAGETGTLKSRINVLPEDADNLMYKKTTWQLKEGTTNVSINSKSGAWSANSQGSAVIQLVSLFNGQILKEVSFTVTEPAAGMTSFYVPASCKLQDVLDGSGKTAAEISSLKIITAKGKSLTADDFKTIRSLDVAQLDLRDARCPSVDTGRKDEYGKPIMEKVFREMHFLMRTHWKQYIFPKRWALLRWGHLKIVRT